MQKILDCLVTSCNLAEDSHIVDVGAGLGRPLLHALVSPGVATGFGIEIDRIKCDKAAAFLQHSIKELNKRVAGKAMQTPRVQCSSIEKISTLNPATHAYSFWEGVPTEGKCAFGKLFAESSSIKSVAVVQRAIRQRDPAQEMQEMGFGPLVLMASFPVVMSGSGRSFTAYVFNKRDANFESPYTDACASGLQPSTPAVADVKQLVKSDGRHIPETEAESNLYPAERPESGVPCTPVAKSKVQSNPARQTPAAQSAAKGHQHTPKPTGISGSARRVPLIDKPSNEELRCKEPPSAKPQPVLRQAKLVVENGSVPSRRSSRLQAQERATGSSLPHTAHGPVKKTANALSPQKAVQKPQSRQKSLEAAGFRTRRAVQSGKARQILLEKSSHEITAKGLGRGHDLKSRLEEQDV